MKAWANFDCFEWCNGVFGASWNMVMADCASYWSDGSCDDLANFKDSVERLVGYWSIADNFWKLEKRKESQNNAAQNEIYCHTEDCARRRRLPKIAPFNLATETSSQIGKIFNSIHLCLPTGNASRRHLLPASAVRWWPQTTSSKSSPSYSATPSSLARTRASEDILAHAGGE